MTATSAKCIYCGTEYSVPPGRVALTERTSDMPPPAWVMVWSAEPGQRIPNYETAPVLHECKKGQPVLLPGTDGE
jgi:hypothetical protein